jgi:hypothetical protein
MLCPYEIGLYAISVGPRHGAVSGPGLLMICTTMLCVSTKLGDGSAVSLQNWICTTILCVSTKLGDGSAVSLQNWIVRAIRRATALPCPAQEYKIRTQDYLKSSR